jgi:quercetin dioxygenase-like cupin family protein
MIKNRLSINRNFRFVVALIVLCVLPLMMASDAGKAGIKSETLLRADSSWNNTPYSAYPEGAPELTVLKITIPAHGTLPSHSHPMPNAAYILSGEITVEDQSGTTRHFSAGQVIPETVNTFHKGVVGDAPAIFIVFYPAVKGMPLSVSKP